MIFHINKGSIHLHNEHGKILITSDVKIGSYDNKSHIEKYGIEINPSDIANYSAHIFIWEYILNNDLKKASIIIENDVELKYSYGEMVEHISSLNEEWDIIIPYDKLNIDPALRHEIFPSRLGYYWGSYFYIVNSIKIEKILSISEIKQPVDEEILEASFGNQLKALVIETDWFKYNEEKCPIYQSRSRFLLDKIKNINLWSEQHKAQAISILGYLAETAQKLNLNLFAHAGTLLGIIRHGEIMPWDDDVDLCMADAEINILLDFIERENVISCTKRLWHKTGSEYYKFFFKDGEHKDGYDYTFPFVDIWLLFTSEENSYLTSDGYYAKISDYLPGKECNFYNASILIPQNHEVMLNNMYKNWNKYIKVFSWSHRQKDNCIDSIVAPIETDDKGRMIIKENF